MNRGDMVGCAKLCTDDDGCVDVGQLVRLVVRLHWVDGVTLSEWLPRRFAMVESAVNSSLAEVGCAVSVRLSLSATGGDVDWVALAQREVLI